MHYTDELQRLAKPLENSNMHGRILYSSVETLQEGKFYFLGINPGGKEGSSPCVKFDPHYTENAYLDEEWTNDISSYAKGEAPLQKRAQMLFPELGEENLRNICASNLIFQQTENIKKLPDIYGIADKCFPIHQYIIEEIVKPKFIISMGKIVFDYFIAKQGYTYFRQFAAGHGSWSIRVAINRDRTLINLPHLSYYNPFAFSGTTQKAKQDALNELKKIVMS